jgi:hypothetical protein
MDMPALAPDDIALHIAATLRRPNPVLFAGAGVGCRVGFPTWDGYIEHLARECERFGDADSALLIRRRLQQRNHLGAATVFKTTSVIPEGEIWKALSNPFRAQVSDADIDKLVPLISLPFSALVTTNYEHSLHDACAKGRGRWVEPVERGALRSASLSRDFFVARIHGGAERPQSMVVDAADYRLLYADADYLDFLLNILSARTCLFVGFSFLDPAIRHVLDIYADKFGPAYPALHLAVVPSDDNELNERLRHLNIQTAQYDPTDHHAELWRAFRLAFDAHRTATGRPEPGRITATFGHGPVHRFVAFAFAQTRLREQADPLAALAQDGLVASVIASQDKGVTSEEVVVGKVASALRLDGDQAQLVVSQSLDRLASRDQILRDGQTVAFMGSGDSELEEQLTRLARDVLDRMRVRDGVQGTDRDLQTAKRVIENVLMSRAWDIGAHYAGGSSGWTPDVRQLVRDALLEVAPESSPNSPQALENAIHALITAPDVQEAELLSSLGRAAFGIQLLLASPRQALFHRHALPRTLYLDASVLMPAITSGHPLRPAYMQVIRRMSDAAANARSRLSVSVGYQFLNEIVSHRRAAVDIVTEAKLESVENLRRHIQLHSALNTNVFVGAYGTVVGRSGSEISFDEFLATAAPFTTEEQLAAHLEGLGITTQYMDFRREHNAAYIEILNPLKQGYENVGAAKPGVLIEHEAQQLTQLVVDAQAGVSSLFVTADRRLRRILATQSGLRSLSGMTVSHIGLVALADVMVGLDADARSLARLVWAAPIGDEEKALFDYFVNLGLQRYDEGLAGELHALAQQSASEAIARAEVEQVRVFGDTPEDVARAAAFLDRFENRFYERWNEAIRRRQASQASK